LVLVNLQGDEGVQADYYERSARNTPEHRENSVARTKWDDLRIERAMAKRRRRAGRRS
jgi:hypothetical protein